MFNPNVYTQFPDHYEDQQIRQQSDIWTQDELQLTKIGGSYENGFYAVDIIDPESPVTVRVIPNGNNIWEDPTTNTVYQVNGIAGEPCEFQLKMLTYEYCNKLISPSINTYDGSYNTPRFGDEVVIREPNNIFHFDAFEGPKQTSWPSPNYDLNDFFDAWYQWYANNWGGAFYWYYWYAPPVTSWNIAPTNVDFRHTPTGIFYGYSNYATLSPVMLGSKSTNLNGLSTILEYYPTQVSYLSPYVSLFFPPEAQINYQLPNFVDNGFTGISNQQNLGIKIVGATFDGFNIILRPYCFANSAYYFYYDTSINPAIQSPWVTYPVVHDHVTVPQNYPSWPWINDSENAEQVYPRYGSYDVVTGLITYNYYTPWNSYYYNWYWNSYGYYFPYSVSGFPYVKARFFLTQKRPVIENNDGNFCKYTYKNAIISYGYIGKVTPTGPNNSYIGGKGLQFHSKGVVCDIEVYFKRKPFPDISSIPGIQQVKSFIAYPQNIRPLDYREYSFKYYITNPIIKVFYAYYNFNDFNVAQQYISPFEIYYPKPFVPVQSWYYYYANAPFEYALNPTVNFVSDYYGYKIPFVYYDPNYDALWTPLFYDINNIPPFILTRAAGNSNYDRLSYLYYAAYPNYNYYYYDGYYGGWAGNTQVEFNGQTANMIFQLNETQFYPTILYGKIWSRYDIEYSNFDSPNLAFRVSTKSYSPSEFFDVYVMHDKFATRGFGDGWFAVEIKNKRNISRGQLNFYDPNKNLLYYGSLNFNTTNAPSGAPLSDSPILSKYFYGNYILDDVYYPDSTNYIDVYWFYSSEKSYSVYENGVFSNDNPDNVFKPFGTFFDGNLNNTNYCKDGVYIITHNSSYSFDYYNNTNLNSGFDYWRNNRPFNPTIEVIIGAFHISTQNNSFSIAAVPIYYIPDIDWTRPYKGCINSSFSIVTYELSKTITTTAYYPELEGLGEIYVKSSWWDNIENLVKIYGPNNQQLILDEDYEIKRINSELMPGDYRIKFLKPIGDLYNNEPTENPARLLDGEYKVFWPSSKEIKLECTSFNDNYASLYRRPMTTSSQTPYYSGNYENFNNEFQLIGTPTSSAFANHPVGQFYQTGVSYDNLQRSINTMSNSTVVGLSPISFYLQNCIFSGFVNDQFVAFKCDINLVENVLPGELPVNPESFNDFLYNGIYAVGNYNY